jgi:hypothetical protein
VAAPGLFGQVVAGEGVGAGPGAAAEVAVVAQAALALQAGAVAEHAEQRGVAVDID